MKLYHKVISVCMAIFTLTLCACKSGETNTVTEPTVNTTAEALQETTVPAPDAEFVTHIIASWSGVDVGADVIPENVNYFNLGASPSGEATAFYVDVDGDMQKEFCLVTDSMHGSCMCVCEYTAEQGWTVSDSLTISKKHTYLMADENGGTYLFAAVGVRPMEGLTSYTYKNGVVDEFELVNIDNIDAYDDESYHERINEAIKAYSGLTDLYAEYSMAYTEDVYTFYWYLAELNDVSKEEYDLAAEKFMSQINMLFNN